MKRKDRVGQKNNKHLLSSLIDQIYCRHFFWQNVWDRKHYCDCDKSFFVIFSIKFVLQSKLNEKNTVMGIKFKFRLKSNVSLKICVIITMAFTYFVQSLCIHAGHANINIYSDMKKLQIRTIILRVKSVQNTIIRKNTLPITWDLNNER